jgi:hypothetical protein
MPPPLLSRGGSAGPRCSRGGVWRPATPAGDTIHPGVTKSLSLEQMVDGVIAREELFAAAAVRFLCFVASKRLQGQFDSLSHAVHQLDTVHRGPSRIGGRGALFGRSAGQPGAGPFGLTPGKCSSSWLSRLKVCALTSSASIPSRRLGSLKSGPGWTRNSS